MAFDPLLNPRGATQDPLRNPRDGNTQPTPPPQPPAPAKPFMAEAVDKYGMPYYGEGFKGFARKVFAKIFDPAKVLPKPTKEQAEFIREGGNVGEEMLEKAGWSKWVESWTGITAEEASQSATAIRLSTNNEEGEFSAGKALATGAGVALRGSGEAVFAGLEALGLIDKAVRKNHAFNVALDDIGDTSTVLPDVSDTAKPLYALFGRNPTTEKLSNFLDAAADLSPIVLGYNLLRASTSGMSKFQKVQTVKDTVRASNMVYSMFWDEAKKAEYMRRVRAGENPDLLMRELENPWVELAGSILGDPTTYMGMGLIGKFGKGSTPVKMFGKTLFKLPWEKVGKIPGFTELLGVKSIGRARLLSAGDEAKIASENLQRALTNLSNAKDDKNAVTLLQNTVNEARKAVREWAGIFEEGTDKKLVRKGLNATYGIFSPDSTAKAEIHKKTVGTFLNSLVGSFRSTDDAMETFKAYRNLSSSDQEVATRAFMHLKELGELPFSELGMQSMEFMTRLIDEVDTAEALARYGDDIAGFIAEITGKTDSIVKEMYPSVDDMLEASKQVKALKQAASPRERLLAKAYDDIKKTRPAVIWANNVNRALSENKAYRGLQSFYSGVLMGMRPAYATRNLAQNSLIIWHDLGSRAGLEALKTGAEALVKGTVGRFLKRDKGEWAAQVLARETDKIKNILGFLPTQTLKGVGSAGTDGFGFLAVGQDIEKVHSAIITRYVVESEMKKALQYGNIPGMANLPKDMSEALTAFAMKNFGDVKKTMAEFRAAQATGFFEAWRHAPLDPRFEDALRRVNLLDELLEIRQVAPDAPTFTRAMDDFIKKIDDLAAQTANEPALVSDTNPMAEAVVAIEKAFEEGGKKAFGERELEQFKALVESREQLRLKYNQAHRKLMSHIARALPPDVYGQFNNTMDALDNVLVEGAGKWRDFASQAFDEKTGIYALSKKGEPPTALWNRAKAVMLDVENGKPVLKEISMADYYKNVNPAELTNAEFNGLFWRWVKDNQAKFWRSYTQENIAGYENVLQEAAKMAGTTVDDLKKLEFGNLQNPQLQEIADLTNEIKKWEEYLDPAEFRKLGKDFTGKTLKDMTAITQDFPNWKGGVSHLFNAVNKDRKAKGLDVYASLDDVPFDEAVRALETRAKPLPPFVETTQPTVTRQLLMNMKGGLREALEDFRVGTLRRWGETVPMETNLDDAMELTLDGIVKEMDKRVATSRAAVARVADETRNMILHDYNKTYADGFAKYMFMYHYWGSRTYMRWMERGLDTPGWINAFYNFRETMGKVHSDQPEFYRYNAQIPAKALFGLNDSPIFFNLEATLNPLYNLTGVDFNDPKRRADWWSSALDDMGKMGFNTSIPLQWATAFNLYRKGEDEAARRWLGRAIPATNDLKAFLNLLKEQTGIDLMPDISVLPGAKYGEFDPFINAQGGFDAYEEKRISRALAGLVQEGRITKEEALELMRAREGELFDEAVTRAINERAPGQLSSFFLGQGFKARNEADMKVDEFYSQYYKLLSMRENMSPEQYRDAVDSLRTNPEYQFADVVLLSTRGGDERDAMYAYNVLGRLPPGDSSQILRDLGVSDEIVQRFYEDKGDFTDWTPQDKERFMSAILDIGATFALPDTATRAEWNEAKDTYKQVQETISEDLGYPYSGDNRGVWDIVSTYYDLRDTNADAAAAFKQDHPEIDMALTMFTEAKMADPLLAQYYVTLDTVESYYFGKTRAMLAEKFGANITELNSQYFEEQMKGQAEARAFLNANPQLKQYWAEKKALDEQANAKILEIASALPMTAEGAQLREGFVPENTSQEMLAQFAGNQQPTFEEVTQGFSDPLKQIIINHYYQGTPISDAAMRQLDYLASRGDYFDGDDLLREVLFSLQRQELAP